MLSCRYPIVIIGMYPTERFLRLKAPTFSYSEDPMDADDWLQVMETKLHLTNSTDEECMAIAAHQMGGRQRLGGTATPERTQTLHTSRGMSSVLRSVSSTFPGRW